MYNLKLKLELPSLPGSSFGSTLSLPQFTGPSSAGGSGTGSTIGGSGSNAVPVSPSQSALVDRTIIARVNDEARNLRVNAGAYERLDPK